MSYHETDHLQVFIANELKDRLALVALIVAELGREVSRARSSSKPSRVVTAERPDVFFGFRMEGHVPRPVPSPAEVMTLNWCLSRRPMRCDAIGLLARLE